ncbi:unnamed protein product [Ambrosiozyma monospora]|uniref:Unnamed protein product n=1 Tax=Ambrosiozyma monospora TaxID=43982 RepID=A0ACB5TCJ2_AMBMO|nr:unnamed protein product [Ambrosiozyma monospora]
MGGEIQFTLALTTTVKITQLAGYDKLDSKLLSSNSMGNSNNDFLSRVSMSSSSSNNIIGSTKLDNDVDDDGLDPELSLVEEKRRLFWSIYSADKWFASFADLPPMITLDTNYGIFTQLPSNSSILKIDDNLLNSDLISASAPVANDGNSGNRDVNDGLFLHEALAKLEENCVLLDMKSAASRAVILTVFERSIKWCHMFLMTADINSLEIVQKIDHDLKEMVSKFEKLLGSLFFLELEVEPMIMVVVSSSIASTYHCILEKFAGFFEQQMKQHSQGNPTPITSIPSFDIPGKPRPVNNLGSTH